MSFVVDTNMGKDDIGFALIDVIVSWEREPLIK